MHGQVVLNEVKDYVDTRCITPPEATRRLLENEIHSQSHAIYHHAVHLPNGQRIFFEEGREEEELRRLSILDSTLIAWFRLSQEDPDARNILYQDVPDNFVIHKTKGTVQWKFRHRSYPTLGRVASVSPRNTELYHLRLLLLNVPRATSLEYLRTVNEVVHNTFQEAAVALELTRDDAE